VPPHLAASSHALRASRRKSQKLRPYLGGYFEGFFLEDGGMHPIASKHFLGLPRGSDQPVLCCCLVFNKRVRRGGRKGTDGEVSRWEAAAASLYLGCATQENFIWCQIGPSYREWSSKDNILHVLTMLEMFLHK